MTISEPLTPEESQELLDAAERYRTALVAVEAAEKAYHAASSAADDAAEAHQKALDDSRVAHNELMMSFRLPPVPIQRTYRS